MIRSNLKKDQVWEESKQPLPQELLMNILRSLNDERVKASKGDTMLPLLNKFVTQIKSKTKCLTCKKETEQEEEPNFVLPIFTNESGYDLNLMLDSQFGLDRDEAEQCGRDTMVTCNSVQC